MVVRHLMLRARLHGLVCRWAWTCVDHEHIWWRGRKDGHYLTISAIYIYGRGEP